VFVLSKHIIENQQTLCAAVYFTCRQYDVVAKLGVINAQRICY